MATKKTTTTKVAKNKVVIQEAAKTIYDALFNFQSHNIVIPKNGRSISNGKEYTYPLLDDVVKETRHAMQASRLVFTQVIEGNKLHTTLLALDADPSNNKLESSMDLGTTDRPQEMGARITYYRRYALLAILGLVGDEDIDADPNKVSEQVAATADTNARGYVDTETAPAGKSAPYYKAWNVIKSAKTKEAIDEIRNNIAVSTKPYEAGEKEELIEIINKRVF